MKMFLTVGQTYHHEGETFEIVKLTKESATLESEEGAILHMSLDDLAVDLENGVLSAMDGDTGEEEE